MKQDLLISNPRPKVRRAKKGFITIQMDQALIAQIEAIARSTQVSRSWLVRAVLSGWIADKGHHEAAP
jgi:predicted transcriptional regulator